MNSMLEGWIKSRLEKMESTLSFYVNHVLLRNKNQQCPSECKVICKFCGPESPCFHTFTCDCQKYAFARFCIHQHVVATNLTGYEMESENDSRTPI